ncbi:hypothetical protein TYRP_008743, partial [Tyrophagus putrescentiae]
MQSFENAVKTCAAIDGSKLLTINHSEEQAFIADLLFTKLHLANSVWLGAKISSQQSFHWENGKKVTFTNWAPENPKNHSTKSCVQIHSEEELQGQWSNEPCTKLNRIVCEKGQTWSLQTMQEIILKMIENPIPIGFIYVQLPQEKAPQEIWPSLVFTDISSAYDSAFFRVVGNKGAAAFGTEQQQQSPAIDEIKYEDSSAENVCGDWATYKEEKCIKSFHWENEKKVTFTNWALGNPKNHSIETCVQMHAEEEVCGKWSNEPCTKLNRVLPQEEAPQEIWPSLIFTDISTQYDSTFFRVAGNKGAAAFGTVQKESLPYIDQVNYYDCQLNAQSRCTVPLTREVKIQLNGGLTGNILTTNGFVGPAPNNHVSYLQFHSVPALTDVIWLIGIDRRLGTQLASSSVDQAPAFNIWGLLG